MAFDLRCVQRAVDRRGQESFESIKWKDGCCPKQLEELLPTARPHRQQKQYEIVLSFSIL